MTEEIWKSVVGYEGLYEVSNLGRVKSVSKIVKYRRWGATTEKKLNEKIIKPSASLYYHVTLSNDRIKKDFLVHRLVAIAFLPNPESLPDLNHKDGNKLNPLLDNLEWVTKSENHKHAYRIGLKPTGEKHHRAKYDDAKILQVRSDFNNGETNQKQLSIKHGLPHSYVNSIVNNKSRCL